ncbi:uncharacterized protein PgNI_01254 [Pyricularia grisea]|uniref:Uncharacterized protein n=1 Tax=Pyricularia grisea TaxID=148305 RepID=A0A6P8BI53_PYRGI|nr:uncharacterized protein PgNI_01254 [Pyricularia grisea]TLD16395.1 hypothetical protein PgNI_01254 [Pyricularia grisea]
MADVFTAASFLPSWRALPFSYSRSRLNSDRDRESDLDVDLERERDRDRRRLDLPLSSPRRSDRCLAPVRSRDLDLERECERDLERERLRAAGRLRLRVCGGDRSCKRSLRPPNRDDRSWTGDGDRLCPPAGRGPGPTCEGEGERLRSRTPPERRSRVGEGDGDGVGRFGMVCSLQRGRSKKGGVQGFPWRFFGNTRISSKTQECERSISVLFEGEAGVRLVCTVCVGIGMCRTKSVPNKPTNCPKF